MNPNIAIEDLVDVSKGDQAVYLGFRTLLRPVARDDQYATLLRAVCCTWCRACQDRIIETDSLKALGIIEEFTRGNTAGDTLSLARNLARTSARRLARTTGKTKEYWACHAVCEAARNNAHEALLWTSDATRHAGLYLDRKLELFREVLQGLTPC
jgi:hypothetical protein